jgi:trehalose synthase
MQVEAIHLPSWSFGEIRRRLGTDAVALTATAGVIRSWLDGRTLWNIHSAPKGGGVAELLRGVLPYALGLGVDVRWLVLHAPPQFFLVIKRIYHAIYGGEGNGQPLGAMERRIYDDVFATALPSLCSYVKSGDIVILHDPQSLGFAPALKKMGVTVLWRLHLGSEKSNDNTELARRFLEPYRESLAATLFLSERFAAAWGDPKARFVMQPSIDAHSTKNRFMSATEVRTVLTHAGLLSDSLTDAHKNPSCANPMRSQARFATGGTGLRADQPLVLQICRWDWMKDPVGLIREFSVFFDGCPTSDAALLIAGPELGSIADDPEGPEVLAAAMSERAKLSLAQQSRVHLALLPMNDIEDNAIIVNALQRHAQVVVQKSIAEGFGLSVTEAMWKGCGIVASAIGGIKDQIKTGVQGLLVEPSEIGAFGDSIGLLLSDESLIQTLGYRAHQRVADAFLTPSHLRSYAKLLLEIDDII